MYIHHVTSLRLWSHYGRSDGKFPHIMIIFTLSMVTHHIVVGWLHDPHQLKWSSVRILLLYIVIYYNRQQEKASQGCSLLLCWYVGVGILRGSIFLLVSCKMSAYILIFLSIRTPCTCTCTCSPNGFDCFVRSVHIPFFLLTKASFAMNVNVDVNVGSLVISTFTSCQGHVCNCIRQKLHCVTDKTWH